MKRICKQCGKEFQVKPSVVKKGKGIFCSRPCFYKWQAENMIGKRNYPYKRIKRICLVCGKEFTEIPSRIKTGRGKFCSVECMGKWYSEYHRKENSPVWLGEIEKKCKTCGKKMLVNVSKIKKGEGIFCSLECAGVWKMANMKKKSTKIEFLIEQELVKRGISYDKQIPIPIAHTVVDFLLPNKIVVYCDGDYWHRLRKVKQRDKRQNNILISNGYKVFRFSETDIKKSAENCIRKIRS